MKNKLIECEKISFKYSDNFILENINISILENEILAIAGPNGAGKSTLIKILVKLLTQDSGTITRNILDSNISYVPQNIVVPNEIPSTVFEIISLGSVNKSNWYKPYSKKIIDNINHAIETVGLTSKKDALFHSLSGGQKQRALIAKALVSNPQLLILDEPTVGLDIDSQEKFASTLTHLHKEHGTSIVLVAHDFAYVEKIIDRILILNKKVIFDGSKNELENQGVHIGTHGNDLPIWLERNT